MSNVGVARSSFLWNSPRRFKRIYVILTNGQCDRGIEEPRTRGLARILDFRQQPRASANDASCLDAPRKRLAPQARHADVEAQRGCLARDEGRLIRTNEGQRSG